MTPPSPRHPPPNRRRKKQPSATRFLLSSGERRTGVEGRGDIEALEATGRKRARRLVGGAKVEDDGLLGAAASHLGGSDDGGAAPDEVGEESVGADAHAGAVDEVTDNVAEAGSAGNADSVLALWNVGRLAGRIRRGEERTYSEEVGFACAGARSTSTDGDGVGGALAGRGLALERV